MKWEGYTPPASLISSLDAWKAISVGSWMMDQHFKIQLPSLYETQTLTTQAAGYTLQATGYTLLP